jgi:hypothetical protein
MKKIIIALLITLSIASVWIVLRYKIALNKMCYDFKITNVDISDLILQGGNFSSLVSGNMEIVLDVLFKVKNNSSLSILIKRPFVRILKNGVLLAVSTDEGSTDLVISPNSTSDSYKPVSVNLNSSTLEALTSVYVDNVPVKLTYEFTGQFMGFDIRDIGSFTLDKNSESSYSCE